MSLAARSGAFSPYLQATNYAVAGPLKPLIPGVVMKTDKLLMDTKKPFLCRESLSGQSAKSGLAVSVSLNGESHCGVEWNRESRSLRSGRRPYSGAPQGHYEFSCLMYIPKSFKLCVVLYVTNAELLLIWAWFILYNKIAGKSSPATAVSNTQASLMSLPQLLANQSVAFEEKIKTVFALSRSFLMGLR